MACPLQVRIDHKNGTVHFGGLSLESERLRDNISLLTRRLAKAATMMDAAPPPDRAAFKAKVGRKHPKRCTKPYHGTSKTPNSNNPKS